MPISSHITEPAEIKVKIGADDISNQNAFSILTGQSYRTSQLSGVANIQDGILNQQGVNIQKVTLLWEKNAHIDSLEFKTFVNSWMLLKTVKLVLSHYILIICIYFGVPSFQPP